MRRSSASIRCRRRRSSGVSGNLAALAAARPGRVAGPVRHRRHRPAGRSIRARAGSRARPRPTIDSSAMSCRKLTCRNDSRVAGSERWTSMNGRSIAEQGVAQRDAGMGQAAGVDDRRRRSRGDAAGRSARPRGSTGRSRSRARARRPGSRSRHGSRRASRGRRSRARACRQVEVRALEDEHGRHRGAHPLAASRSRRRPAGSPRRGRPAPIDVVADDHAVRGRQDQAEPAAGMLLVDGEMAQHRRPAGRGGARSQGRGGRADGRSGRPGQAASRRPPARSARRRAGRRRPPRRGAARHSRRPPRRHVRASDRG